MTPKLHIISADAGGSIDATLRQNLLIHLPNQTSLLGADAVIVVVSYFEDFHFNELLYSIDKPVILVDMLEYFGFALEGFTYLLGEGDLPCNLSAYPQWQKLSDWVASHPPILYFKRELLQQHRTERVIPIEWPCVLPAWEIESKAAFDRRPFEVFYSWGYSNALRPRLAGEIYDLMADGKIEVVSSFDHIDAKINEPQRKWISIHTPHTHRVHINDIMRRQAQSKMSVSLPGSGRCCFRSTEVAVHTVPVMLDDGHAWSHPWVDGLNCLKIHDKSVESMALQLFYDAEVSSLHDLYVEAQRTIECYRTEPYIRDYIMPAIQKVL